MSSGLAKKEGCLLGKLSSNSSEEGKSAFRILNWAFGPLKDATTKLVVASLFCMLKHTIKKGTIVLNVSSFFVHVYAKPVGDDDHIVPQMSS